MTTSITFTTRKTLFASLLALGIAGGAQAQAPSTLDVAGHSPGYDAGGVVGGGRIATTFGSGDDRVIQYSLPAAGVGDGAGWSLAGPSARFAGSHGDGQPQVEYAAPTAPAALGREAWLSGGGDDAQVTYTSPDRRR
jgi:hypothetical protein